ncbi:hypothetical protein TNCV_4980831 [Trichonephila clavipes]|nr:hypothetical protein TNCV_4980831 [Trichonephila clavipes]
MGRTILLERRQTESVGRWDSRSTFLRSDWPKPFARRKVGMEMDWVDPKINDPRQGCRSDRFSHFSCLAPPTSRPDWLCLLLLPRPSPFLGFFSCWPPSLFAIHSEQKRPLAVARDRSYFRKPIRTNCNSTELDRSEISKTQKFEMNKIKG